MKTQVFELAPVEGLDNDQLAEMANLFTEKSQQAARQTVRDAAIAGNALNTMQQRIPHGQWRAWLGVNYSFSYRTAWANMKLAANVKRFTFEPESIREAMKLIAEQPDDDSTPITPRAERIPNRVAVSKPAAEPVSNADELGDDPKPITTEVTNRTSSPATRKASEANRAVPMVVTPEIVEEQVVESDVVGGWFRSASIDDIVTRLIERTENAFEQKKTAKALRKWADKLDPPKKFVPPDVEEVAEYCQQRNNRVDPEAFVAHYAANGWKMSNGNKLNDWKAAIITWEKRDDSTSKQTSNGRSRQAITDGNW